MKWTEARSILRAGLTGGIASGKSDRGPVLRPSWARASLDADEVARAGRRLRDGGAHQQRRGPVRNGTILQPDDGRIDRAASSPDSIFSRSRSHAKALNAIVHPEVTRRGRPAHRELRAAERRVPRWRSSTPPCSWSRAYYRDFHRLIVVRCSTRDADPPPAGSATDSPRRGRGENRRAGAARGQAGGRANYVIDTEGTLRERRGSRPSGVYGRPAERLRAGVRTHLTNRPRQSTLTPAPSSAA